MTDRSFFTDDEWAAIAQAPLHVTTAVVAVAQHGPISLLKEASATAKSLARPGDRGPSPDEVVEHALGELAPATTAINRLPIAEAAEVRAWLIDLANAVAD